MDSTSPNKLTTAGAWKGAGHLSRLTLIVAGVALIVAPFMAANPFQVFMMNLLFINILLAVGLDIVKGMAGQVTVGQVGLSAIGAYVSAILSLQFGLSFWICLPLAICAGVIAGIIVGVPSFRLSGAYLGLATLGFAESVRIFLAATPEVGAASGISGIPAPRIGDFVFDDVHRYYFIVMPISVFGIYLACALSKSGIGRAFRAIREDALAAAAAGIPVRRYKLLAFVLSATYAACAGSLIAHQRPGFIAPDQFTLLQMITVLLMVVLGGMGRVWGAVIGAIIVTFIDHFARSYYQIEYIIFGMTIVMVSTYMPAGLTGVAEKYISQKRFLKLKGKPHAS